MSNLEAVDSEAASIFRVAILQVGDDGVMHILFLLPEILGTHLTHTHTHRIFSAAHSPRPIHVDTTRLLA